MQQLDLFSTDTQPPPLELPDGDPPMWFGIAGWSYDDWLDVVYPRGTKDTLSYVARYVDLLEINSSFYRPPSARTAAGWLRGTRVNPRLHFTAKIHQGLTHSEPMDATITAPLQEGLRPLAESGRLLTLLAQFRYDFDDTPEHRDRIRSIRDAFASLAPLTVEVRHRSWQQPGPLAFLNAEHLTVANLDYPTGGDSFDMPLCRVGKRPYLRLHGRNREAWFSKAGRNDTYNYLYSRDELDDIAHRAAALAKESDGLIAVANNHFQGKEMVNILELKSQLTGTPIEAPPLLERHYPRLRR